MNSMIQLEKPAVVYEAAEAKRGMHWALELLVFVPVFIVATLFEIIILFPGELLLLFLNPGYQEALLGQDVDRAMELGLEIASSDGYTILTLFANIGMILAVWLFCRLLQKRRIRTLGFCGGKVLREYVCGVGAGFLVFSAAVLICVVTGALEIEGLSDAFSPGIFLLFTAGYMV